MSRRSRTSRRIRELLSRLLKANPEGSSADQPDLHALEPRVLYSAAPMVDLAEDVENAQVDVEIEPPLDVFEEAVLDWESESFLAEQPATEFESASGIIFVDGSVEDYESLVQDLAADSDSPLDIVLLDSGWDGVEQITETLSNYGELSAVHIVSHGTEGNVQLGNTFLNQQSLSGYAGNVESWSQSLAEGADILFYGCDLAADSAGEEFVDSISSLTGADVAASDDLTGHDSLGGDWDLEYQTGEIETDVAFSDQLQSEWVNLLADFDETAWSGSNTFVDGAISFSLSLTGGGTIDWSYDGTTNTLTISDNDGTTAATNLTIADNNGGLIIDSVIFDTEFGSINSDADIGTLITEEPIDNITVGGGSGNIGAWLIPSNMVNADATVNGNVSTLAIANNLANSTITINGDLATFNVSNNFVNSVLQVTGDLGSVNVSSYSGTVNITADQVTGAFIMAGDFPYFGIYPTPTQVVFDGSVVNSPPTITSGNSPTIVENQTTVMTVTATDPTNDPINYSLTGGTDASRFAIDPSTGELTFITPPDFETPADLDLDNVYEVEVTADDGNGATDVQTINVTVTDGNDDPTITSDGGGTTANINAAENTTAITTVTATDTDLPIDTLTFAITGGADAGDFSVDFNSGVLTFNSPKNFESPTDSDSDGVYEVEVTVSDGNGGTDVQTIHATVTNANEDPTITSDGGGTNTNINVAENTTAVTTVTATDPDLPADTLTYAITGGADAVDFSVDPNSGVLTFDSPKNFESPTDADSDGVYEVEVTVSDGNGGADLQTINVTVTDINENPVATDDPENFVAAVNNENPIGYWRLGESVGSATVDETGNNDGTYNGVAPSQTGAIAGDSNTAVSFDGSNDFLTIAHDPAYLLDEGTVQLWFNPASTGSDQGLFSKDSSGFDTGGHLTISLLSSGQVQVRLQSDSSSIFITSASAVSAGQWHHVAFSFGPQGMSLFVDGALADSNSYSGGLATTSGGVGNFEPIVIGASTVTSGNSSVTPLTDFFGGLIDEVAIFDSQLDGQAIQNLFAAGVQDYTVNENSVLNVSASQGVLVNDLDPESDPLTVTELNGNSADLGVPTLLASGAQVTLQSDGSFVYDTNGQFDFLGVGQTTTDFFAYTIDDGAGNTDTATATITITGANDAPVISTNNLVVAENQVVVGTVAATDIDVPADTLRWSLTGSGADDSSFSINPVNGSLIFITPPSFESPGDADGDNVYEVDVQVFDGTVATTKTINVFVTDGNDDPTITSDGGGTIANINVTENTTAVTTVTATDPDLPADILTFAISGGADAADFSIDASTGVLTFSSPKNFEAPTDSDSDGVYEVEVTVSDGNGGTDVQTINVTVTDINENPTVATNNGLVVSEGSLGNVISQAALDEGDPDDSGTGLTYTITANVSNGVLRLNGFALGLNDTFTQADVNSGRITYDHDGSETGSDQFDFSMADGGEDGTVPVTGTFNIAVNLQNDEQSLDVNLPANVSEGGSVTVTNTLLSTSDGDHASNQLVYTVDAVPANGTLLLGGIALGSNDTFTQDDIDNNRVSYQHGGGESASDSFDFTVDDGLGTTTSSTFIFTVNPVNDEQSLDVNSPLNLDEGSSSLITSLLLSTSDVDNATDELVYSITSAPANGQLELVGNPGIAITTFTQQDVDNNLVVYVHDGSESITDSFDFDVDDALGIVSSSTFTIFVNAINDSPLIVTNTGATASEGSSTLIDASMLNVFDPDDTGLGLTYTVNQPPVNGQLELVGNPGVAISSFTQDDVDNNRLVYVHDGTETLTDGFDFAVADGGEDGSVNDSGTFNLVILPSNDAPTINDQGFAADENLGNGTLIGTVVGSDPDAGDSLTFTIVGGSGSSAFQIDSNNGDITVADSSQLDFETSPTLTLIVETRDSSGATDTGTITISLNDVNDRPVILTNMGATTVEGQFTVIDSSNLTALDQDDVPSSVQFDVTVLPANGYLALLSDTATPVITFTQADINSGQLVYIHDGSETNADLFEFFASDDSFASSGLQTFNLTITPFNDAPVAIGESFGVNEDTNLIQNVVNNDFDAENQTLSARLVNGPTNAKSFVLNSDGSFSYLGLDNFSGSDSFTYVANDGAADSNTVTVNITINPVNDAPTTRADQFSVLQSDLLIPFSGVLQNDFDIEGSPLSAILVNAPANGTLIFNADGTFIYQSDFDFTGIDVFTYMATDGTGASVATTVQIEVVGVGFTPTFGSEGPGETVDDFNPTNNQNEKQQEENKTSYMQISAPVVQKANTSPDDFSNQLDRESVFDLGEFKTESLQSFAKANQNTAEELLSWVAANPTQAEEIAIDEQLADELVKNSVTFVYNQEMLWEQFDQLSENGGSPLGLDLNLNITIASSSVLIAAGFILWTLRGGMLMASMISSLPTWKFIDPLSVLESESAGTGADENEDAAEKIFAQANTPTSN